MHTKNICYQARKLNIKYNSHDHETDFWPEAILSSSLPDLRNWVYDTF